METELIQKIADQADDIEQQGRIPGDLVDDLRDANYFSLLLPEKCGGRQMAFPTFLQTVQTVASADGSVGWCVNQGSVLATLANQMSEDATKAIWQDSSTSLANGPPIKSEAVPEKNGYRLNGHWAFSSGIDHADWLLAVAPVKEGGQTLRDLWFILPKPDVTIAPIWNVNGLKGTASYQFMVKDLHVPTEMAFGYGLKPNSLPLYQLPTNLLFACGFGAVALGVARGALDAAIERARKKVQRFHRNTISENETNQIHIGRTEAVWQAAESFLHTKVAGVWQDLEDGQALRDEHRVSLRMAGTHAIRQAKEVTDIAYELCSTDSIFTDSGIQRRFQDMHVITQQVQARPEHYAILGRYYLGVPFESHMIN